MENTTNERRRLSHNALVESAIRMCTQLASSNDVMTRTLANRMYSDLTLLRRGLPQRRQREGMSDASSQSSNSPSSESVRREAAKPIQIDQASDEKKSEDTSSAGKSAVKEIEIGTWSECQTAWRTLDNESIDWRVAFIEHVEATKLRIAGHKIVYCLPASISIEYPDKQDSNFDSQNRQSVGLAMQAIFTFSQQLEPLGLVDSWLQVGSIESEQGASLWTRAFDSVIKIASTLPAVRMIFLAAKCPQPIAFIKHAQRVAASADWLLPASSPSESETEQFWGPVQANKALGEVDVTRMDADKSESAKAHLQLWARRMEIPTGSAEKIWATCVVAREIDSPEGTRPEAWYLMTNRPAQDLAGASDSIALQRNSRLANAYFPTDACAVASESLDVAQLERKLTLRSIISWRAAMLAWNKQINPDFEANRFFSLAEMRGASLLVKRNLSDSPPLLIDMLGMLRQLGSSGIYARNPQPNYPALERGIMRVMDAATILDSSLHGI